MSCNHVASNLRGRAARDAPHCPRHRHSAPLCRGNVPGGSVHGVCGDRSASAASPGQGR